MKAIEGNQYSIMSECKQSMILAFSTILFIIIKVLILLPNLATLTLLYMVTLTLTLFLPYSAVL